MWDLIVSVPDHCLSFYFITNHRQDANLSMALKAIIQPRENISMAL